MFIGNSYRKGAWSFKIFYSEFEIDESVAKVSLLIEDIVDIKHVD